MNRPISIFLAAILMVFVGCAKPSASQPVDGDIIFQTSRSPQSTAIQLATHSKYSHMGIVFLKQDKPYVFEAGGTVQYTPLAQWIERGIGGHYVLKRLRNGDQTLTPQAIEKLKQVATQFRGKPYDLTFEWSDDRIYCSELVWKIYERGLGIRIGQLKKLRDFDFSADIVKNKLKERYGANIPMEETVISPGDMFDSPILQTVSEQ